MIHSIFYFTLSSFLLGGFALYKCNQKENASRQQNRWTKYGVYFFIVHLVIGSAMAGPFYFNLLVAIIIIIGAYELFQACRYRAGKILSRPIVILSWGIYILLSYGLFIFSKWADSGMILFVYIGIAAFDGFSQLTGQWIGSRQLAPAVSPNKTVEGVLGGFSAVIITAILLRSLVNLSVSEVVLVSLLLGISGLTGDLAASYFKRLRGIKNFGTLLPGHGGVLDRFDGFLLAAPTFFLWDSFIK
ncbi:MAG: phosphatidate cytidylyltransferase [Nitrospiria bacterium]